MAALRVDSRAKTVPKSVYKPGYTRDSACAGDTFEGDVAKRDRKYLIQQDGHWHYFRRVPKRFRKARGKRFEKASTGTRDLKLARPIRDQINAASEQLCARKWAGS